MIRRSTLVYGTLITLISVGLGGLACYQYTQFQTAQQDLAHAQTALDKAGIGNAQLVQANKTIFLSTDTAQRTGKETSQDVGYEELKVLLNKLFSYDDAREFAKNAVYVKAHVGGGSFIKAFYGDVGQTENEIKAQGASRTIQDLQITKSSATEYFAILQSAPKAPNQSDSDAVFTWYALYLTRIGDNTWKIDRAPGFSLTQGS